MLNLRKSKKIIKMNNYPDNWVVIFLNGTDPHYRILAGWSGGYLSGDSWKLNSGITSVKNNGNSYSFYGTSGSCYICDKESYTLRMNNSYIWETMKKKYGDKVKMMPEDTDWMSMDWIIS